MNKSKNLISTIHIVALIAVGSVPAAAAGGTFAADAAGTEGRALREIPIEKPLPPVYRGEHRHDRSWWYPFHRGHGSRVVMTPVIGKRAR